MEPIVSRPTRPVDDARPTGRDPAEHRARDRESLRVLGRSRRIERAIAAARTYERIPMRTSLSFLTTTAAVAPAALRDAATPHTFEVLGLDRARGAIHLVEHTGPGVPLVHVMHLAGEHAGRPVIARSLYEGPSGSAGARVAARLAELRASLTPLVPTDADAWMLSTRVIQRRALRIPGGGPPIRKFTLALTVEPIVLGLDPRIGRATVTSYLRPRAAIDGVWLVPGEPVALARIAYLGTPSEIGHDKHAVVLVGRPAA